MPDLHEYCRRISTDLIRPKTPRYGLLAAFLVLLAACILGPLLRDLFRTTPTIGRQASTTARKSFSMAWRSSGATNEALIENLARNGLISSERVKKAMLGVQMAFDGQADAQRPC